MKVEGGKGNDTINEIFKWDTTNSEYGYKLKDKAETFVPVPLSTTASSNAVENFYGNQGDDSIWGGYETMGDVKIAGGSGHDKLYGGFDHKAMANTFIYGNSGRDLIRTDWWEEFGDPAKFQPVAATPALKSSAANEYIYGDFKYGVGALDADIWGDSDVIYGGNATPGLATTQKISAGDGDDKVTVGDGWET